MIVRLRQAGTKPQFSLATSLPDVDMGWLSRRALIGIEKEPQTAAAKDNGHLGEDLPAGTGHRFGLQCGSHAENRPDRDVDFGGFDLGPVAEPEARYLDEPALGVDAQAVGPGRDNFTELLAADRAESWRHDLFRVEQIKLLVAMHRPGAWRRVAAADQVIDEIDVTRPVDARLGVAHPALIGRLFLVLGPFGGAPGGDEVGGLHQRLDPKRKDLVEIKRGGGVVGSDRAALLEDDRPLVEAGRRTEDRQPGLAAAADDRPRDRGGPTMQGQ